MDRHRQWPWRAIAPRLVVVASRLHRRHAAPTAPVVLPPARRRVPRHPPDSVHGRRRVPLGERDAIRLPDHIGCGGVFLTLGIPVPEIMAPIVGVLEIVGGTLFSWACGTRLAALPLLIDIVVAIASTKIPLLLGTSPLPPPPSLRRWASGRYYMRSAQMTPNCSAPSLAPRGCGAVGA